MKCTKVKIFVEGDSQLDSLETAINRWLEEKENEITLVNILQSSDQYRTVISIFYHENTR